MRPTTWERPVSFCPMSPDQGRDLGVEQAELVVQMQGPLADRFDRDAGGGDRGAEGVGVGTPRGAGARTDSGVGGQLGRGGFWDEVIIAHTLQNQEARRIRARVRDQMRASGAGGSPMLTDVQLDALIREM